MESAQEPMIWWKIRDTPFTGKRLAPLIALAVLTLPNQAITTALAVVWIVLGHFGLTLIFPRPVHMQWLRMAIDSGAAVLLNVWVLLQWSRDVSVTDVLVPLFFLVQIFAHSGLHRSALIIYLTAILSVLLLLQFVGYLVWKGAEEWPTLHAPDTSLGAAGSYILFIQLVGFSVFQSDTHVGERRSPSRAEELLRCGIDLAWVLTFVYSDVARSYFITDQMPAGILRYVGIVALQCMTVVQFVEFVSCLQEQRIKEEITVCAMVLIMCVAALVTPYALLWVVFGISLVVAQIGGLIDLFMAGY